jgi:hypothetical protein
MMCGLGILHFCIPSLLVRLAYESVEPIIYHVNTTRPLNFEPRSLLSISTYLNAFFSTLYTFFHSKSTLLSSMESTMDQSNSTKMTRLDRQFNAHKEEIRQVHSKEGKPLGETMDLFEKNYGLKAG